MKRTTFKTAAQLAAEYLGRQIAQATDPKDRAKFEELKAKINQGAQSAN